MKFRPVMLICGIAALQWTGCACPKPPNGKDFIPTEKKKTYFLFTTLSGGPFGGVSKANSTASGAPSGNGQLKCTTTGLPAHTQWYWYAGTTLPTNPTWRETTYGPKNLPASTPWRVHLHVDSPATLAIDDIATPLTVGQLCTVTVNYQ